MRKQQQYAPVVPYHALNATLEEMEREVHDLLEEIAAADQAGPPLTDAAREQKWDRIQKLKVEIERVRAEAKGEEARQQARKTTPRTPGPLVPAGAHQPIRRYWESDEQYEARNRRTAPRMSREDVRRVEAAIRAARLDGEQVRRDLGKLERTFVANGLFHRDPGPKFMPIRPMA